MLDIFLLLLIKFIGWTLFVFACVNTATNAAAYIRKESSSVGWGAFLRMVVTGIAFALWSLMK